MTTLKGLLDQRPNDIRIKHNLAICEYALSGKTKTSHFQTKLTELEKERQLKEEHKNGRNDRDFTNQDFHIFLYNQAVVSFHQRLFNNALDILVKLKENTPENTTRRCWFNLKVLHLMADCYINLRRPQSAIIIADQMEGVILEQESELVNTVLVESPSEEELKNWRYRQQSIYSRAYLMSLNVGQDRPKNPSNKEVKSFTKHNGSLTNFVRAAFEVRRNNGGKALKILNCETSPEEGGGSVLKCGESIPAMYSNNMAIVMHKLRKYTLASACMNAAQQQNDAALAELPRLDSKMNGAPLITLSLSRRAEILRNFGIIKLFNGQNEHAFDLLIASVETHFDCARVWLRIAECCVAAHSAHEVSESAPLIAELGEGCARLLIANSVITERPATEYDSLEPQLSLSYAALCIQNALALCPKVGKDHPEYNAVNRLYAAILATGAWVALKSGDYSRAADLADTCRKLNVSNAYSFLADLYLSESLVHLDRVSEAIDHLKHAIPAATNVLKNVTLELFSNNAPTSAYPKSCSQAKAAVFSNLAACYCLQSNNLDRAGKQIGLVTESIPPEMVQAKTILLAVYISLKEGNKPKALQILKTKNISHFKHSAKT